MFTNKTVFILGAGASWHYGYPTGEELVKKVIKISQEVAGFFADSATRRNAYVPKFVAQKSASHSDQDLPAAWSAAQRECDALSKRLQHVNPPLIDYFLGQNRDLRDVGKLMIAWVILECAGIYSKNNANINRREALENSPRKIDRDESTMLDIAKYKDDWYRFVIYK
jgi:hypothetical protein